MSEALNKSLKRQIEAVETVYNPYHGLEEADSISSQVLQEECLIEATWRNPLNLNRHYEKQVLKEGEKFNPDDPKFASNMTLEDYKEEAEKLSNAKADKSVYQTYMYKPEGSEEEIQRRSINLVSDVIGWVVEPQEGRVGRLPRRIKVSKFINPKFFPEEAKGTGRYRAAVFYVDEPGEDNIISYFIIKDSRFKNLFNHQWLSELPENQNS